MTNLMIAIFQTIERLMANVTVIAMGATVHLVIVTPVTNVMIGKLTIPIGIHTNMIPMANQVTNVGSLIPMANLAVIAMGVTAHQVIVTQVTNMVSGKQTIEK